MLKSNLAQLNNFFGEYPNLFEWKVPDGGCVGYPRYIGRGDVENFCHRLIEEAGILLLPSSIYKSELIEAPTDRFRIGFGRKDIEVGLEVFREFLNKTTNSTTC